MNREFEQQPMVIERRESNKKYSLNLEEVRKVAKEGTVVPIFRTLPSDLDTPVSAYLKLSQEKRVGQENKVDRFFRSFLLESVMGGESVGRYSYIGINPKEGVIVTANEISTLNSDGTVSTQNGERIDPLKAIQEKVSKTVVKTAGVPPFSGGYVGYLGYEVVSAFERTVPKSNPDVLGIPEAMLFNFDNIIVFDHARNELKIVGNINVDDAGDLDSQYREVTSKIDAIVDRIHTPVVVETKNTKKETVDKQVKSNFGKEEYMAKIRRIREYLEAGDAIQVVLSQRWARKTNADPFAIYRALRRVNPSPFMVYFDMGDFKVIGASPELLLKVENRSVSTWPIAGTRARGKTIEEDARLEEELRTNEKERAEHVMLVDLGRNDVGRISLPGTVKVPKLMEVSKYSNVMHLASEVTGKLADNYTPLDAQRSIFPAGTVSGAPKIRAMQIIDELETEQRGAYAGEMGYISYDGDLEMAITIRTIVFDGKTKTAYIQAGGGIVFDSDPEAEYEETIAKSKGSLRAIDLAEEEY